MHLTLFSVSREVLDGVGDDQDERKQDGKTNQKSNRYRCAVWQLCGMRQEVHEWCERVGHLLFMKRLK